MALGALNAYEPPDRVCTQLPLEALSSVTELPLLFVTHRCAPSNATPPVAVDSKCLRSVRVAFTSVRAGRQPPRVGRTQVRTSVNCLRSRRQQLTANPSQQENGRWSD